MTHEELDDPAEPRAAWLVRQLVGYAPLSREEAEARLYRLLAERLPGATIVSLSWNTRRTWNTRPLLGRFGGRISNCASATGSPAPGGRVRLEADDDTGDDDAGDAAQFRPRSAGFDRGVNDVVVYG